MTTQSLQQTPTNDHLARLGNRRRTITLTVALIAGVVALTGAVTAMAGASEGVTATAPVPASTPTAPAIDSDRAEEARSIIAANTTIAGNLGALVDTAGLAGNSANIKAALDASDELALSVAVSQTSHARAFLMAPLAAAIEAQVRLHPSGSDAARTELIAISAELVTSEAPVPTDDTAVATSHRIAELLAVLTGQ